MGVGGERWDCITIFFGCGTIGGGVPMGSHARRAAEVADIFILLGRNENSAMTVGGGCWFLDSVLCWRGGGSFRSGMQSPTGAKRGFAGGILFLQVPRCDGGRAQQQANHHHRNGDFNQRKPALATPRRQAVQFRWDNSAHKGIVSHSRLSGSFGFVRREGDCAGTGGG